MAYTSLNRTYVLDDSSAKVLIEMELEKPTRADTTPFESKLASKTRLLELVAILNRRNNASPSGS
jgi:hypothetical protein